MSFASCNKCKNTHKRVSQGEAFICVTLNEENCAIYDIDVCTTCKEGYYLESGDCKQGDTITNCKEHSSKTECRICKSGTTLTDNKKNCSTVLTNDRNCKNFK